MKAVRWVLLLLISGFLIVFGGYQIAQELGRGADLQPLPLISGALGLIGLIVLILSSDTFPARHRATREGRSPADVTERQRQHGSYSRDQ